MRKTSKWAGLVSILLLTTGVGCGGGLKTYPVEGKVMINGEGPLTVGEVVFTSDKVTARGQLKSDGTFALSTYKEGSGDGAPAGEYEVAIIGAAMSKKTEQDPYAIEQLIDPKYADRKMSGLKYTVEPGPNSFGIGVEKPEQKSVKTPEQK